MVAIFAIVPSVEIWTLLHAVIGLIFIVSRMITSCDC